MIFLDAAEEYWILTRNRAEMIQALLEYLPDNLDDSTLMDLASACLGCEPLDVVVLEATDPE